MVAVGAARTFRSNRSGGWASRGARPAWTEAEETFHCESQERRRNPAPFFSSGVTSLREVSLI